METISQDQLIRLLCERKGANFATLLTETEPKMRKNELSGRVTKKSHVNVAIGVHYERAVQRQQEREGLEVDFTAKPRQWGERLTGTPLVRHTNKAGETNHYLEAVPKKVMTAPQYLVDGFPANENQQKIIAEHLSPSRKPATQNTEKEIVVRDYKLTNVKAIKINGKKYKVQ